MAVEAVKMAITKSTTWRGATEEFSNIYTIAGLDIDSETAMTALVDKFVAAEKLCHASVVSFVRAQIYSYGEYGPNFMYHSQTLSGAGAVSPTPTMYKESAVLLRAKLPRTFSLTRSNQPYLRKYLHTCHSAGIDISGGSGSAFGTPAPAYTSLVSAMNAPGPGLELESESGAKPIGAWEMSGTVHHRQFRRGRKEK